MMFGLLRVSAVTGSLLLNLEPPLTILRTEPTDQTGLQGLLQRLQSLGIRVLGAVVNGADPDELFVAPVTYATSAA